MEKTHSYHIFYFPFKWNLLGRDSLTFSEQTNLENFPDGTQNNWIHNPGIANDKEGNDLYNEKNFFYEFVHPVLYDNGTENTLIKHYERREPQETKEVYYVISPRNKKKYTLKVESINLNLYTTGVGVLTFYLQNTVEIQNTPQDILTINQYGRRIFPPFIADIENRYEIAESIAIEGLKDSANRYYEDFKDYNNTTPWKPAKFISNLLSDLSEDLIIRPIIDDRMFVNCWYPNSNYINDFKNLNKEEFREFLQENDFWYKYLFVDVNSVTCKNPAMRDEIVCKQTYPRWQNDGMLYGASRYSFVFISDEIDFHRDILSVYMRTIYSRMIELVLVQRASTLRFSEEIIKVSGLSKKSETDKKTINRITSLYKEYIRFINKVHFREVTTQDQGIELYNLLSETLKTSDYIKDLDKEIEELYQFINLIDDKERNKNAEFLNLIAAIFLPATFCAGVFSMNNELYGNNIGKGIVILTASAIMLCCLYIRKKMRK